MKDECRNDKLHLQSPPRDSRGFGSGVWNVERMDRWLKGVGDDRNAPGGVQAQLQLIIRRVCQGKTLRRSQLIEAIDQGKALQKDRGGIGADNSRVYGWSRINDGSGGGRECWVDVKGATM